MDINVIWFILIIVLFIGYAVLDGFDLGIGAFYLSFKKEDDRKLLLKSIGPFWDGNEVWLVAAGGALFAAFPIVYASLFSGLYIPLMLLLVGIIFRALAIEFRNKEEHQLWRKFWDVSFAVSSILVLLLLGVAVGNLILGLPLTQDGYFRVNLFDLFAPFAVLIGVLSVFFFAMHGAIYIAMKTEGELQQTTAKKIQSIWLITTIIYFLTVALVLFGAIEGQLFIASGIFLIILPLFVKRKQFGKAFIISVLFIVSYIANLALSVFPNWIISTNAEDLNLTIYNASSSADTLEIMLIIALIGMPFVIGYTIWVYRKFRGKVKLEE